MDINCTISLPTFYVVAVKRVYHGGAWHELGEMFWLTANDVRALGSRVRVLERVSERTVQSRIDLTRERLGF